MASPPENSEDNPWQKLDSLIELQFAGNAKPLQDYISQNDSDPGWRENAIEYLIRTCGHVWEGIAMEKI